jgi:hypothetical protein
VSSTILNEGASDSECNEDEQSDGTKHGSNLRRAVVFRGCSKKSIGRRAVRFSDWRDEMILAGAALRFCA